jgi:hypothetical protein
VLDPILAAILTFILASILGNSFILCSYACLIRVGIARLGALRAAAAVKGS